MENMIKELSSPRPGSRRPSRRLSTVIYRPPKGNNRSNKNKRLPRSNLLPEISESYNSPKKRKTANLLPDISPGTKGSFDLR